MLKLTIAVSHFANTILLTLNYTSLVQINLKKLQLPIPSKDPADEN